MGQVRMSEGGTFLSRPRPSSRSSRWTYGTRRAGELDHIRDERTGAVHVARMTQTMTLSMGTPLRQLRRPAKLTRY